MPANGPDTMVEIEGSQGPVFGQTMPRKPPCAARRLGGIAPMNTTWSRM